MVNTRTVHANWKENERGKKALILSNDWSHVVKNKICLFDTGTERETVEHEEKVSERELET